MASSSQVNKENHNFFLSHRNAITRKDLVKPIDSTHMEIIIPHYHWLGNRDFLLYLTDERLVFCIGLSATTLDASVTTALSFQRKRTILLAESYIKAHSPRGTFFIVVTEAKILFLGIRLSRMVPTKPCPRRLSSTMNGIPVK